MSKKDNKSRKTRAEIAAERGISIRNLQHQIAHERAALPCEFRRLAAQAALLADRVNRILPVILDEREVVRLKRLRDILTPGAYEVLGIVAPEVIAAMEPEGTAS